MNALGDVEVRLLDHLLALDQAHRAHLVDDEAAVRAVGRGVGWRLIERRGLAVPGLVHHGQVVERHGVPLVREAPPLVDLPPCPQVDDRAQPERAEGGPSTALATFVTSAVLVVLLGLWIW